MARTLLSLVLLLSLSACGGGGSAAPETSALPIDAAQSHPTYATAWGVQLHLSTMPKSLEPIKGDLGASFVRLDLARDWEIANGWGAFDNALALAKAAKLQMIFILPDIRYTSNPDSIDRPPFNLTAYTSFVRTAVARYAGNHVIWEIINEPNIPTYFGAASVTASDYMSIVQAVVPVVRAGDPGATIITGGTSGVSLRWQSAISGIFPLVDGVGVHPYGETPSGLVSDLEHVATLAGGKPAYVTEFGLATADAAQQLTAQLVAAKGYVPYFSVYEYQDQDPSDNFGLLTFDGRQRPTYPAVKAIFHS
jgi:hypothetical protein